MRKPYAQLVNELPTVTIDGKLFYVAEGDLLLNEEELVAYASEGAPPPPDGARKLVIIRKGDKRIMQRRGEVLKYCVARESFGLQEKYDKVVECMAKATGDWQSICNVKFSHVAEKDVEGADRSELLFPVRYVDRSAGGLIASAFFPDDPIDRRVVLIYPSFFTSRFDPVGVLRHELGHALGFRHEHIRSEAPAECPRESLQDTEFLSKYDPKSVMHYFCGKVGNQKLEFSDQDRADAREVYGPPEGA